MQVIKPVNDDEMDWVISKCTRRSKYKRKYRKSIQTHQNILEKKHGVFISEQILVWGCNQPDD